MAAPRILRVTFTLEEFELVTRPARRKPGASAGGFQIFLRKIQARINRATRVLDLLPQDLETAKHYATYTEGTFERQCDAIIEAARRAEEAGTWVQF